MSCTCVREKTSSEGTVSVHVLERKVPGLFHKHDRWDSMALEKEGGSCVGTWGVL